MTNKYSAALAALLACASPAALAATSHTAANQPEMTIQSDQLRAHKMIGAAVYDRNNQKIGSVQDLVLNKDGTVADVVVSVGRFLGMGGKDVAVSGGGTLLRQVLAAGLLDEFELHIAPVLLGDGMRLFDASLGLDTREGIELTPVRVIETPEVTHIRYAVGGRAKLELDDRGSGGA